MAVRVFIFLLVAGILQAQPPLEGTPVELASLRYIDIEQGTGAPAAVGKKLTVHYTGWLKDGTKFDSSLDRNEPLQFVQGRRQVILGWDLGFAGMRVGGKRRLLIPYQMAYGETANGPIPARADLIFDVELLGVDDVTPPPQSVDLLVPFIDLETRVMALAHAIPADKYSWRPASVTSIPPRTFAQIFTRIANEAQLLNAVADEDIKSSELENKLADTEKTPPGDKDTILSQLATDFAAAHKDVADAGNGFLGGDAELYGKPTTRRGVFASMNATIAELLGKATAYAEMNGIAIP